jgi:hypothetical protein
MLTFLRASSGAGGDIASICQLELVGLKRFVCRRIDPQITSEATVMSALRAAPRTYGTESDKWELTATQILRVIAHRAGSSRVSYSVSRELLGEKTRAEVFVPFNVA